MCVCVIDLVYVGEGREEGRRGDRHGYMDGWVAHTHKNECEVDIYLCDASSIIPPKFKPITSAMIFPNAAAVMVPIPKERPMLISM